MIGAGSLDSADRRPLDLIAAAYPLTVGADVVLVGMRRPEYVSRLRPLLAAG